MRRRSVFAASVGVGIVAFFQFAAVGDPLIDPVVVDQPSDAVGDDPDVDDGAFASGSSVLAELKQIRVYVAELTRCGQWLVWLLAFTAGGVLASVTLMRVKITL